MCCSLADMLSTVHLSRVNEGEGRSRCRVAVAVARSVPVVRSIKPDGDGDRYVSQTLCCSLLCVRVCL